MDVPPVSVSIKFNPPETRVKLLRLEVLIDQREALEDIGLERHLTQARRYAAMGREAALRATARWAREGDELRDPQWGYDVAQQTEERGKPPHKELNVDVAPKRRVRVDVVPGEVNVDVTLGSVHVEVPFDPVRVDLRGGWIERLRRGGVKV